MLVKCIDSCSACEQINGMTLDNSNLEIHIAPICDTRHRSSNMFFRPVA